MTCRSWVSSAVGVKQQQWPWGQQCKQRPPDTNGAASQPCVGAALWDLCFPHPSLQDPLAGLCPRQRLGHRSRQRPLSCPSDRHGRPPEGQAGRAATVTGCGRLPPPTLTVRTRERGPRGGETGLCSSPPRPCPTLSSDTRLLPPAGPGEEAVGSEGLPRRRAAAARQVLPR